MKNSNTFLSEQKGHDLTCPWHYAVFDIRNATVSDATVWATELTFYPIKIEETTGNILINLQGQKTYAGAS